MDGYLAGVGACLLTAFSSAELILDSSDNSFKFKASATSKLFLDSVNATAMIASDAPVKVPALLLSDSTSVTECTASNNGMLRSRGSHLEACLQGEWMELATKSLITQSNPAESCADSRITESGTYFVKAKETSRAAYCDMDYDGGGWEVVAHTPDRAHVTGWDVGTDSGTVADFLNGWTNVKSSRAASTMISKFRGRYLYTEDQPGLPQTGTTFDTHIDFVPVASARDFSDLSDESITAGRWYATAEGATCTKGHTLFTPFWDTLTHGRSGGSASHNYCGFYGPGESYEGWCAQAYPVNQCNRAGYGRFTKAWYYIKPPVPTDSSAIGSTSSNPASSCAAIKDAGLASDVYFVTYGGQPIQVYCDTDYDDGKWAMISFGAKRTDALTYSTSSNFGTVGNLAAGFNILNSAQSDTSRVISTFRGRYTYVEDQPGIPQTGRSFDTFIDFYTVSGSPLSFSDLSDESITAGRWKATAEGATCTSGHTLFTPFWDTLTVGRSGGSASHNYCGFYGPGQSYEGWCAQAYPVNQCNRAGYGKFTKAWYYIR